AQAILEASEHGSRQGTIDAGALNRTVGSTVERVCDDGFDAVVGEAATCERLDIDVTDQRRIARMTDTAIEGRGHGRNEAFAVMTCEQAHHRALALRRIARKREGLDPR